MKNIRQKLAVERSRVDAFAHTKELILGHKNKGKMTVSKFIVGNIN